MNRIDRRTYLTLVVSGSLVVAGCAGDEGSDEGGEPSTGESDVVPPTETGVAGIEDDIELEGNTGLDAASEEAESATDDEAESEQPDVDVVVGERLELGDFHLVVNASDRVNDVVNESTGELVEAGDDGAFAVLDIAFRYVGDEPVIAIEEHVAAELVDDAGVTYDIRPPSDPEFLDSSGGVDLFESRLAPGELVRGDVVYEIDDGSEGLVLELASVADGGGSVATDYASESESDAIESNTDASATDLETVRVDLEAETDSIVTLEQDPAVDVLSFAESVDVEAVELTVTTLEHGNNLGGFMQSEAGYEIIAVGLAIENASGRDRSIVAGQSQLTDEFGRRHAEAPRAVRALERFHGLELAAGDAYDGKVAYQIEEGLDDLYWVFDFTEWGAKRRVFWKLR